MNAKDRSRAIARKWFGDSFSISLAELVESEILAAERASRDRALEEAALDCEQQAALYERGPDFSPRGHAYTIASRRIRALKSTPPAPEARETAKSLRIIKPGTAEWYADQEERTANNDRNIGVLGRAQVEIEDRVEAIETALRGLGGVGERT